MPEKDYYYFYQNNRKIALAAVKQNSNTLQFVSTRLKTDSKFIKALNNSDIL